MDNISSVFNFVESGLFIEPLTKSSDELLKEGYVLLDNKSIAKLSPILRLVEAAGLQKWIGDEAAKKVETVLKGAYRCVIDGKVVDGDILANVKNSTLKRGIVLGEKGITKNAAWEKINPKEIVDSFGKLPAPNIVAIIFQVLSIATSQYYMHEMNNNFLSICNEIMTIKEQFMIQDASEIIAGHRSLFSMVNHFEPIMDSVNRCQSESIKAGLIELDALKQIERSKIKLEKNYVLNPKKDNFDKANSNIIGIVNSVAQLKMSVYVFGMAKGLKVCFDGVDSPDEVALYTKEISEQVDLYISIVNKTIGQLNDYISNSKALNHLSPKQIGLLIAMGVIAGDPHAAVGIVSMSKKMQENLEEKKSIFESTVQHNINLNDVSTLRKSIIFLEDYAVSTDDKLELVSTGKNYYIKPIIHVE